MLTHLLTKQSRSSSIAGWSSQISDFRLWDSAKLAICRHFSVSGWSMKPGLQKRLCKNRLRWEKEQLSSWLIHHLAELSRSFKHPMCRDTVGRTCLCLRLASPLPHRKNYPEGFTKELFDLDMSRCVKSHDETKQASPTPCLARRRTARNLQCLDMFGYVWICLDMFGYVWICLDMFGYVWICLDMFGYVCWRFIALHLQRTVRHELLQAVSVLLLFWGILLDSGRPWLLSHDTPYQPRAGFKPTSNM